MLPTTTDPKHSDLPLVPESVLRKRHNLDDLVRKRKALAEVGSYKAKKGSTGPSKEGNDKKIYVKKPETFIARARSRQNQTKRYQRVKAKGMHTRASNKPKFATREIAVDNGNGDTVSTPTPVAVIKYQSNSVGSKMVFVIRIRGDQGISPQVKSTLHQLRLKCIHDGVFVRYDDSNRTILHTVEPWIVYGRPSVQVIADLIERRGYGRIISSKENERIPLSDNTVIEDHLGMEHNIICKEDLVHEIDTVGDAFDAATQFLFPFKLVDSKTEFERTTLKLKDGKDYGDRGDEINEYIQQVL